ncbi:MAG: ABC transporter ATP-binding protein [Ilumatobacteraceae bacterium]|nr:ABC transporter ATP-binding protein [Ilumatobacteraceae bacterium]
MQTRHLTKRYGSEEVVRDVDLDIATGELFVLVGPSGCGKTSLLRIIAGLEAPSSGVVLVDGVEVADDHRNTPVVAMMFQEAALYPHLDVRANIGFPLKIAGERSSVIDRSVRSIASMLGIRSLLTRRPAQISGGQRQRVAMARSLIRRPEVLLMDEPMSNLDAKLRGELRATIGHLHGASEMTMVYVTHDQVEAMALADRLAVMRRGRLIQIGTPSEVFDRPVDAFVATFIGVPSMNLFHGRLAGDADGPFLRVGDDRLGLARSRWAALDIAEERDVVVGVRPRSFRFSDDGLIVDVERVETVAERCTVTATLLARPVTIADDGVVTGAGRSTVTIDAKVTDDVGRGRWQASRLTVDADDIHLFDHLTGRSLAATVDRGMDRQIARATT